MHQQVDEMMQMEVQTAEDGAFAKKIDALLKSEEYSFDLTYINNKSLKGDQ